MNSVNSSISKNLINRNNNYIYIFFFFEGRRCDYFTFSQSNHSIIEISCTLVVQLVVLH
jgi:hypothetical protein